jgi:anti-anti-sigma factor
MDSTGLRALMNLDVRGREEGWALSLASPQAPVMRLLKLSGFEERIAIRDAPG